MPYYLWGCRGILTLITGVKGLKYVRWMHLLPHKLCTGKMKCALEVKFSTFTKLHDHGDNLGWQMLSNGSDVKYIFLQCPQDNILTAIYPVNRPDLLIWLLHFSLIFSGVLCASEVHWEQNLPAETLLAASVCDHLTEFCSIAMTVIWVWVFMSSHRDPHCLVLFVPMMACLSVEEGHLSPVGVTKEIKHKTTDGNQR